MIYTYSFSLSVGKYFKMDSKWINEEPELKIPMTFPLEIGLPMNLEDNMQIRGGFIEHGLGDSGFHEKSELYFSEHPSYNGKKILLPQFYHDIRFKQGTLTFHELGGQGISDILYTHHAGITRISDGDFLKSRLVENEDETAFLGFSNSEASQKYLYLGMPPSGFDEKTSVYSYYLRLDKIVSGNHQKKQSLTGRFFDCLNLTKS